MNRLALAISLVGILGARPVQAQAGTPAPIPDSTAALVHQLVERSRAVDLAVTTVEANVAAQRQLSPGIPPAFWDRFLGLVHARRDELGKQIEGVYARHFSASDLRALLAFYDTPIGKKLLDLQPTIAQESMAAGRDWGRRIGMEAATQLMQDSAKATP